MDTPVKVSILDTIHNSAPNIVVYIDRNKIFITMVSPYVSAPYFFTILKPVNGMG